ncbi:hypothetical protein [Psychroserpens sp. Hel_I_66]|uniref:hypothetical protein n=1 Tax=Psychroserpens sp. Hel_I_66 TaxID=1250004 RepID=UPI00064581FB|nr:hypothetical protein [Psychroserpens sp. Hel_I_66]
MKSKILLFALLLSLITYSQNGINYKAVIKDDLGNVLDNTFMNIQFTIHQTSATGTIVYQEAFNYTSDSNGIVILNIGTNPSPTVGIFETINWKADIHFLQTTITYSGGTLDFDATQFMAVPYALSAGNVSGLEKITENGNEGWRLINSDPTSYNDIGDGAVNLSVSNSSSNPTGASGFASFTSGYNTEATGSYSTAMGESTIASGFASTIVGKFNVDNPSTIFAVGNGSFGAGTPIRENALTLNSGAGNAIDFIIGNSQIDDDDTTENDNIKFFFSGQYGALRAGRVSNETGDEWNLDNIGFFSTAFGNGTMAFGSSSFASGRNTIANGFSSTAMGNGTIASSSTAMAVGNYNTDVADAQFLIGNGNNDGNRSNALTVLKNGTIIAPSFDLAEILDDKALITKEYADTNLESSGVEQYTDNEGRTGWQLIGLTQSQSIGTNAIDLSQSTIASPATGALGTQSFAVGRNTVASGNYSTALGDNTNAPSYRETVIGTNNTNYTPVGITNWNSNDRLFVIGNGFSDTSKNDALVVLKNGTITAPSLDMAEINTAGDNALITKEYADSNYLSSSTDYISSSSNLVPLAYGIIESNANVLNGTGNFSATISSNVITISIDDEIMNPFDTTCIITPYSTAFRSPSIIMSSGNIQVRTFNISGNLAPVTFQFVIYKL